MSLIKKNILKANNRLSVLVGVIYLLVVSGMNLFGYFNLPEKVATRFTFTGKKSNFIPTNVYLLCSFFVVLIMTISFLLIKKEQKVKWISVTGIIVVLNMVMIFLQI